MDTDKAIKLMWRHADKPERMRLFLRIVEEHGCDDSDTFWTNFWSIWESSENLFEDHDYIAKLLEHGEKLGNIRCAMDGDELKKLDSLGETFVVFRGCTPENADGWSWTTDYEKAKMFANRSACSAERQILVGRVDTNDVLVMLLGRNESEIVVHPEHVTNKCVESSWHKPIAATDRLIFNIHSGRDLFGDDSLRADLIASTATPEQAAKMAATIEEDLEFIRWAELSNLGYFETLLSKLRDKVTA